MIGHQNISNNLPTSWLWVKLGGIAEINPKLRKNGVSDDLEVSFLPMKAVEELTGKFDPSITKRYSQVKKGYTPFLDGDIIFAKITPCMENGKIAIVNDLKNGIGFGSTEFHVIRLIEKSLPKEYFFYYLLQEEFRRVAKTKMKGTAGQLRVSSKFMNEALIPLPPLAEQYRIVARIEEFFTKLDAGVESLKKARTQLRRYRQGVLNAAVEGKLTRQWRQAHKEEIEPAWILLERILKERQQKREAEYLNKMKARGKIPKVGTWKKKFRVPVAPNTATLPELPETWVYCSIDQITDVGTGATPLRSNPKYYESGNIPWVKSNALNRPFVTEADEMITEAAINETNAKLFPIHTLLVAMYGEGKTRGKVSELLIEAATNQACAAIIFKGEASQVRTYAKLFLQKNYEDIRRLSSGGVQPNLNLGIIRSTAIPLPSLEEQRVIVDEVERRLSVVKNTYKSIKADLKRAERLRQSILRQAFSGKLVLQDPTDEPASLLLNRINRARGLREFEEEPRKQSQTRIHTVQRRSNSYGE